MKRTAQAMGYGRFWGTALFLLAQSLFAQDARLIGRELLALRPGVTARAWLATHPQDKFEVYPDGGQHIVQWEIWRSTELTPSCAVASTTLTFGGILYSRRAYFNVPEAAALRVPSNDTPHPEFVKQCILSEIELVSIGGIDTTLLSQIDSAMSSSLGAAEPFRYNLWKGADLSGANTWVKGREWNARMSRWIIATGSKDARFRGVALAAVANRSPLNPDELAPELTLAHRFLPLAGMSADQTERMKELLDTDRPPGFGGSGVLPAKPETIASMLADWVAPGGGAGDEARAARLFIANVALKHAGRFDELLDKPDFQEPLKAAGADIYSYEPCGCFIYGGNWLVEAWRAAPESAPGRQAYLIQLAMGFNVRGTCGGDADEVVKSGELYLKEHPVSPIRAAVMLHVADGYAEKVALRYVTGPPSYVSEGEAGQAFPVALKYYRRVMAMFPGSAEALDAKRSVWAMLANPRSLPIRWNCLGGD